MKQNYSLENTLEVVTNIIVPRLRQFRIFTLQGPLGAGKTTLIRTLLGYRGVTTPITSPTFSYVNTYEDQEGIVWYHFDLYRIQSVDQFINAGFIEYLADETSYCLIEWPQVIESILKSALFNTATCSLSINYIDDQIHERELIVEP